MQLSTESFWSEIKVLEDRLKSTPDSYCFAQLADVYLRAGLLDDALSVSRSGVARYPGFVAGQLSLARTCHQKGLIDECRKALEVVTTAVPDHAEAQRMLARLYSESGRGQEAIHALQVLLDLNPEDISARHELDALQRRFQNIILEDELELIEFTEADIVEEIDEQQDSHAEPLKKSEDAIAHPYPDITEQPEIMQTGSGCTDEKEITESAEVGLSPDLGAVWASQEQELLEPATVQPTLVETPPDLDSIWGPSEHEIAEPAGFGLSTDSGSVWTSTEQELPEPATVQPVMVEAPPDLDSIWAPPEQEITEPAGFGLSTDSGSVWASTEQELPEPATVQSTLVETPTDLDSIWAPPEQETAEPAVTLPEPGVMLSNYTEVEKAAEKPEEAPIGNEKDPLVTSTMAELYASQGHVDKAIFIYRNIIANTPSDQTASARLTELEQSLRPVEIARVPDSMFDLASEPVMVPAVGISDQAKVIILEGWLDNIRRLRKCR